jgi:hypothetical protein
LREIHERRCQRQGKKRKKEEETRVSREAQVFVESGFLSIELTFRIALVETLVILKPFFG